LIEQKILAHLVSNEAYVRKVLPFIKSEYFSDTSNKVIFEVIRHYFDKYNAIPSTEALLIDVDKIPSLSTETYQKITETVKTLDADNNTDMNWLLDQTETYCQDRAVYNAIMESISIIDGKSQQKGRGSIPQILSEALAISFDNSVGHDFLGDTASRYEFYHRKEEKIEFDLDYFNVITRGGLPRKTLNVALAGTGVGKTLFMCHAAAANLSAGYNVLYITMEMAEERIAERIDSNLLNVTVDELQIMPRDVYDKKINRIKDKCKGRLIIKEYPTSSAGSSHFRHLIQELKIKKNFTPDIIYIDYLNICASSRMKMGNSVNSYTYIKAIAEELRGLSVEFNIPLITATQTNRDGYNSSDVDLTNTSESFGLPATADFMFALISTEELEDLGQLMVKQLKNRYNDLGTHRTFCIGVDRSKMRLYDVESSANKHDTPVMDQGRFGDDLNRNGKKDFSKLRI
jgi:archaellum biogenesis ATPase FlaH